MEENIQLGDLLQVIIRRRHLIIICSLIFAIITTTVTMFVLTPVYESTGDIFIGNVGKMDESYTENDITVYLKMLKNYCELMEKDDFIEKAISRNNIDIEIKEVKDEISVTQSSEEAQILTIAFKYKDKYIAQNVVESMIEEFIDESADIIADSKVKIIEHPRIAINQASPNNKLNMVIGIVSGTIVGCVIAFMFDFNSNIFRNYKEFKEKININVIGIIPLEDRHILARFKCKRKFKEAYSILRNNLEYILSKNNFKSILVTSAESKDGKTIVSSNLAFDISRFGRKVIIIDCNLQKPNLDKIFKLPKNVKLMNIASNINLENIPIKKYNDNLDILPCDVIEESQVDMKVAKDTMIKLINKLKKEYYLIVLDGGNINNSFYTQVLSTIVDTSIIVSRQGLSDKEEVLKAKRIFENNGISLSGAVLNENMLNEKAPVQYGFLKD